MPTEIFIIFYTESQLFDERVKSGRMSDYRNPAQKFEACKVLANEYFIYDIIFL